MRITRAQAEALARQHRQADNGMTYLQFRRSTHPTFGMNDAITVKWCGMWLAIEADGYTHS